MAEKVNKTYRYSYEEKMGILKKKNHFSPYIFKSQTNLRKNRWHSFFHLAVDKATKKFLFGWFEFEEITKSYYVLLFNMIINYGIPQKIKADNRSTFSANNAKNKEKSISNTI